MDVIATARLLGKAIQEDAKYVHLMALQQVNDEDQELQNLIGEFNLKRVDLNGEIAKPEKDQSKVDALNAEIRELYAKIMGNSNMSAYTEAKNDVDALIDFVMTILRGSVNGQDPDLIEQQQSSGCSGSCSSCSGCN